MGKVSLFDSHSHVGSEIFNTDRKEVYRRALDSGLAGIIEVGVDIPSSRKAIALAQEYHFVYASVGIQPWYADSFCVEDLDRLRECSGSEKVVAIGEAGLDSTYKSSFELQKKLFCQQLELAQECGLPLIIHQRQAEDQFLEYFSQGMMDKVRGVFHCYSGNVALAVQAIKKGYYISFSGIITFKNFKGHDLFTCVPLDKVLIETDSPYLAPEPRRGKRNEPSFLTHTARKLAEIYETSFDEFLSITWANGKKLFGL